jgi:hypothetical protein
MIEFRGAAKRIEDIDLPRIGRMIGVGEDEIHAVLDVESGGSGFDSKGRPKMLFEPHIFYRELAKHPAKRAQAVAEKLAYDGWRPGTYPSDSYPRLIAAMQIDETAALRSASWGLGQILGNNHQAAGYATVQDMIRDFVEDEDNHLEAMIRFIKAKKLDDELRNHEWAAFARGYNGAAYAAHNYHGKLKAAYERWQRIKDTPYVPGQPDVPRPVNVPVPPAKPPGTSVGKAGGIVAAIGAGIWAVYTFINDYPVLVFLGIAAAIAGVTALNFWRNRQS